MGEIGGYMSLNQLFVRYKRNVEKKIYLCSEFLTKISE